MGEAVRQLDWDALVRLEGHLSTMKRARLDLDKAIAAAERDLAQVRVALSDAPTSHGDTGDLQARPQLAETDGRFPSSQFPYLRAGVRLIERTYGSGPDSNDSPEELYCEDILAFITPTRVCEIAGKQSVSSFYLQWPKERGGRDAYVLDLLRYVFQHPDFLQPSSGQIDREVARAVANGLKKGHLAEALHRITARAIKGELLNNTNWYLQLTLSALLHPRNKDSSVLIRECIAALRQNFDHRYEPQYRKLLSLLGLTLRPGITYEDLTDIIGALSEGLALRYQTKGPHGAEPDGKSNLFGIAVLALLDSLVVPANGQDRWSIEERINAKFRSHKSYAGRKNQTAVAQVTGTLEQDRSAQREQT